MIDWEKLNLHSPLEKDAYKAISAFYPLKLEGDIATNTIAITDSGLDLVPHTEEEMVLSEFYKHLKDTFNRPFNTRLILNRFVSPRKERWGFELEDRAHALMLAIRVFSGKNCYSKASFRYNDAVNPPVFYSPLIISDHAVVTPLEEDSSVISSHADFEKLQRLYNEIFKLELFKHDDRFSKLLNAMRFYDRFDQNPWFLQKIVNAIIGLESLFTDQSKEEITYKVSTRVAYFLYPDDPAARHSIFDLLKIAYGARSSFLHGSKVDEEKITRKLQALKQNDKYSLWFDLPSDLNQILSKVLENILLSEDNLAFFSSNPSDKAEADFYNRLVLGKLE